MRCVVFCDGFGGGGGPVLAGEGPGDPPTFGGNGGLGGGIEAGL